MHPTSPASATSLPRTLAGGLITIKTVTHATFGAFDVVLAAAGSRQYPAVIQNSTDGERRIPQDTWAGLQSFLAAATLEANRGFAVVSVGIEVLAQLFAERVLTQLDLRADNLAALGRGAWEIHLGPNERRPDSIDLRFSPQWTKTHAGKRDPYESDLEG